MRIYEDDKKPSVPNLLVMHKLLKYTGSLNNKPLVTNKK
jgi:hypothetical protein